MQDTFTNICLRIFLSFLVTNCYGERSFSALKRVKSYLRSKLKDEKFNNLALMHIESFVLQKLNLDNVLNQFVYRVTRKMLL